MERKLTPELEARAREALDQHDGVLPVDIGIQLICAGVDPETFIESVTNGDN